MAMTAVTADIAMPLMNQFVDRATVPRVEKRAPIDTNKNRESNHPVRPGVGMKVGTARPFRVDY